MMQVGDEYDSQGNDAQERFQDDALCLERRVENLGVGKADGLSGKVADETERGIECLHEQSHEHAAGNFEQCQPQKVKKISRRRRQKNAQERYQHHRYCQSNRKPLAFGNVRNREARH